MASDTDECPRPCKECGKPVTEHSRCDPRHLATHREATRRRRRALRLEKIPPTVRESVLRAVAAGATIREAAKAAGTTEGCVQGLARAEREFRALLDDALVAGRDPALPHGTSSTYRRYGCRCPDCRAEKNASRGGPRYATATERYAASAARRRATLQQRRERKA